MRNLLRSAVAAVLVGGIIVALLPVGVEFYAESWFRDQGVEGAAIRDVDLNPFTGRVRLEGVTLPGSGGERAELALAELNFEWTRLPGRKIVVTDVRIADGFIELVTDTDDRQSIGGFRLPVPDEGPDPGEAAGTWAFGIEGLVVEDVALRYRDPAIDHSLSIHELRLDAIRTFAPARPSTLHADLRFDVADIEVRLTGTPLSPQPEMVADLRVAGLVIERYGAYLAGAGMESPGGVLGLRLNTVLGSPALPRFDATAEFELEISDPAGATPFASVQGDRLAWSGNLRARGTVGVGTPPVVTGSNDLRLTGFAARHREKPIRLLMIDEFAVEDAVVDEDGNLTIGNIVLTALEMLGTEEGTAPALRIADALLSGIAVTSAQVVDIERIGLGHVVANLEREPDGRIRLVSEVMADLSARTAEPADLVPAEAGEPDRLPLFRVGEFGIGADSQVNIADATVEPVFASRFDVRKFHLSGFGNVDPAAPAHLIIDIGQDDSARIFGEGDIALFAPTPYAEIRIEFDNFDLTQVSSYVPAYHIQRGRLSLRSDAKLSGEELAVANKVELEKLKLSAKAAGEKDFLGEGMAMPLDVALDLLRDQDDRIELDLPVSGSLKDPQFDTGDVLRTAMQNAMQKAAMRYAKKALQPLGTIMFVAKAAGQAARPRFQPVAFAPAAAELTPEAREYLDKIASMLGDRPALSITLCGIASAEDLDAMLAERLAATDAEAAGTPDTAVPDTEPQTFEAERMALARSRGNAVARYLVSERGIADERLFRCRPRVETAPGEGPRAEITL